MFTIYNTLLLVTRSNVDHQLRVMQGQNVDVLNSLNVAWNYSSPQALVYQERD